MTDSHHEGRDDLAGQNQLLNVMWAAPPKPLVWHGYRDELEKAVVNVPIDRNSDFAWINVQWRQPRLSNHKSNSNSLPVFERDRFDVHLNSLALRLVDQGFLETTHLLASFPPAIELKVIENRWLAWMLIAKSSGHLWSIRCSVNLDRLRGFYPNDIAESVAGLCWHCALYVRRDRLDLLSREVFKWEKEHGSEIAGI